MASSDGTSRLAISRARADALALLAEEHFPVEITSTCDGDSWGLFGAALLSRATTTLRQIFDVSSDEVASGGATLTRSLYEHVVHFAWLAADPTAKRIEEWRKHDLTARLIADSDCRAVGVELFTSQQRAAMEAQIAAMDGERLVLTNLAIAADRHWGSKLAGMGTHTERGSFRGLYAIAYRNYSGTAHPSYRGLNCVVENVGPNRYRVVLEKSYDGHGPYGMATVLYGLLLLMAAGSLGWPDAERVHATFERFPSS